MDKPISLSVKDYIVRKLAVKLMIKEEIINAVVSHQFQSANEALYKNSSVEISGFGKFYFNYKKAKKKLDVMMLQMEHLKRQLINPEVTEKKKQLAVLKIEGLTNAIEYLKPKIDEIEILRDLRGMEESSNSTIRDEASDTEHIGGKTGDLQKV